LWRKAEFGKAPSSANAPAIARRTTREPNGQKEKSTLASETNGGVDVRCTTKQLSQSRIGSVNDH